MASSTTIDLKKTLIIPICTIGFLTFFTQIFKFLKWVYSMFLRPPKKLNKYGSWALVTGSTDGIGKCLSFELASKGLNLILIGRNPQKLQTTSNEIRAKFGKEKTKIKIIVIDFEKISGEEIEFKICKEIEGLDVGVLINNVGLSSERSRFFHEIGLKGMIDLVSVNVGSVNWVTKAVLPGMLKRKKGAIVNIGSGSSVIPSYPLFSVYAASKAYVAMFSRSLSIEYKQFGIDIQCQVPMLVATKMASIKKASFFIPSPEQFSKASIKWIVYDTICVPYWTHALEWCIMNMIPDSLVNRMLLRYFISVRKKVLRKENNLA
ncbi:very-long-chain 3-oxoacyl-CoA reductase 1-like [Amaranthus tricolor]|uniref:very-long-chain 3-oxoacyl-CoA reductase 1-like n=1 Tax=Amaranthus tricolor TaxID=29722 RepID=UPI00258A2805|nr:very-long-chain 3-oxoacyl-CoA reductase 1-like [Amaranthus tricolor]